MKHRREYRFQQFSLEDSREKTCYILNPYVTRCKSFHGKFSLIRGLLILFRKYHVLIQNSFKCEFKFIHIREYR